MKKLIRPRSLSQDEDLTWHDLYRRIKIVFPDIRACVDCFWEWKSQRDYYLDLYARLDKNGAGRYDRHEDRKGMKKARKEWKAKH